MSVFHSLTRQGPIQLGGHRKSEVRTQFGALCWRIEDGKVRVLMITTRGTGRWTIPKGWPMHGVAPAMAAEVEAREEAGVRGRASAVCVGLYAYAKEMERSDLKPCVVAVFPVRVESLRDDFPERDQRKRKWMSRKKAAKRVDNRELAEILRNFDPVGMMF